MEFGQRVSGGQIQGARDYQEDNFQVEDTRDGRSGDGEHTLLVLADGMGGHAGGKEASDLAIASFIDRYRRQSGPVTDRLRHSLDAANEALAEAVEQNPALDGMGCTLVGAVINKSGLQWVSVGDSPMWLYSQNTLRRLNADHSMAPVLQDLVETGRMTEEEAASDRRRNALRSAVMGDELSLVDLSSQPISLGAGDKVVLASDGLQSLSDQEISMILTATRDLPSGDAVNSLLVAVDEKAIKGQDNTTVIVAAPDQSTILAAQSRDNSNPANTISRASEQTRAGQTRSGMRFRLRYVLILLLLILAGVIVLFSDKYQPNSPPPTEVTSEPKADTQELPDASPESKPTPLQATPEPSSSSGGETGLPVESKVPELREAPAETTSDESSAPVPEQGPSITIPETTPPLIKMTPELIPDE